MGNEKEKIHAKNQRSPPFVFGQGLNQSQVAAALNMARSTVQDYLRRADAIGLTSEVICGLAENALEKMLFKREEQAPQRPEPDCKYLHLELR